MHEGCNHNQIYSYHPEDFRMDSFTWRIVCGLEFAKFRNEKKDPSQKEFRRKKTPMVDGEYCIDEG